MVKIYAYICFLMSKCVLRIKFLNLSNQSKTITRVEKTADRVTIKNKGQVLYNQAFSDNDANCRQATTTVKSQVWNYDDSLGLAVFDNSVTRKCCCLLFRFILFDFLLASVSCCCGILQLIQVIKMKRIDQLKP